MDGVGRNTGSGYRDGNVPNGNGYNGKLNVNWYNPGNANGNLRAREAVVQEPRIAGLLVIAALHSGANH